METKKKGTGALVCGIISVALGLIGYFAFAFGEIAALVLAIIATVFGAKSKKESGAGMAGFVLGIIGIISSAIGLVLWIYSLVILLALAGAVA